uniref:Uncharacterized protein n=1 Tax=Tetranychus urticae TaxID=32264 RepID=T1KT30_TETUR
MYFEDSLDTIYSLLTITCITDYLQFYKDIWLTGDREAYKD